MLTIFAVEKKSPFKCLFFGKYRMSLSAVNLCEKKGEKIIAK